MQLTCIRSPKPFTSFHPFALLSSADCLGSAEFGSPLSQVVGEMGFFFGMRHITHARAASSSHATLFALPKADYSQLVKLYPDQVGSLELQQMVLMFQRFPTLFCASGDWQQLSTLI